MNDSFSLRVVAAAVMSDAGGENCLGRRASACCRGEWLGGKLGGRINPQGSGQAAQVWWHVNIVCGATYSGTSSCFAFTHSAATVQYVCLCV